MAVLDTVIQEGLLINRKWLQQNGIDRTAVDYYLRSGRLKAVSRGIYRKPGPPLKWQNIVYSLTQLGNNVHVGHMTALKFHGYQHSLEFEGREKVRLYSDNGFPGWIHKVNKNTDFLLMKHNPFVCTKAGIEQVPFGTWDWPVPYSSPERAFLELMSTIKTNLEISQALLMMEGAAGLRPRQLQEVLETCSQIKAKRLFLWMARISGHAWYGKIAKSRIDLGSGKRQIVPEGVLDNEFQITVPREVFSGQIESLF